MSKDLQTSKALEVIRLIMRFAKSNEELCELTGSYKKQITRALKLARSWGADIECIKEKADGSNGKKCYYKVKNPSEIRDALTIWTEIERRMSEGEKPLLIKPGQIKDCGHT